MSFLGYYSWRRPSTGSWFMQVLCDVFDKYGYEFDLLFLLTIVNRRVAIDFESNVPKGSTKHQKKQILCISYGLTKLIKFEKKKLIQL